MVSGGYDERFNGYHWGDFVFLNRLHTLFFGERLDFEVSVINKRPFHYLGKQRQFLQDLEQDIEQNTSKNPLHWYKHKTINFEWKKIWI
jgi:predicted glycosyltransferase involved in capsule biosynthesis